MEIAMRTKIKTTANLAMANVNVSRRGKCV